MTAPTPRPRAERAPEGEVTAAVERAAEAIRASVIDTPTEKAARIMARAGLGAALDDVEEMARVLHREGAWCGVCEYDVWDACKECRETVTGYAASLRAAILGGAA